MTTVAPAAVRLDVPRAAAAGLGLGLAWAVAARIWMRLISTDPEFSWAGTGFILGAGAVTGLGLGIMYGLRLAGRSRWRRLLILCCLPLFAGPGMVFAPVVFVGGLAFSGRGPWSRVAGWTAIAGATALVLTEKTPSTVVLGAGFFVLAVALAAGAAELYRRPIST